MLILFNVCYVLSKNCLPDDFITQDVLVISERYDYYSKMRFTKGLKLSILSVCLSALNHTYGQGCSDAGFCTIDSFKPGHADSTEVRNNQIKIGAFYGGADHNISVYGNYLEYNRQLNDKLGLDLKLTTLGQNGNGISSFGLSDVFLNANYEVSDRIKLTLGAKAPLSDGGESHDGLPLPMDYQSSLGTFDLILGLGFKTDGLRFVAAIQQPLTQNSNKFVSNNYPLSSDLRAIQTTNGYHRKGDVLLRVSYPISASDHLIITPSLLPIYHLGNDTYIDEMNQEREITGSQGLTLNGNVYLDYKLNDKHALQLNLGAPFIFRDARPDGLTRSFVANFEYRLKF